MLWLSDLGHLLLICMPKKLEQVDIWLSGLIKSSNRQFISQDDFFIKNNDRALV
jgi:hypothetical protein